MTIKILCCLGPWDGVGSIHASLGLSRRWQTAHWELMRLWSRTNQRSGAVLPMLAAPLPKSPRAGLWGPGCAHFLAAASCSETHQRDSLEPK